MMKLVALLIAGLIAAPALSGLDPDSDSMGIYFDTAGNTVCANVGPFVPTAAYLLLMNPSDCVDGFECTVTMQGAPHFILSTVLGGTGALDVDASPDGFAVGAVASFPVVSGAVLLVTWSIMLQAPAPLLFYINNPSFPSILPDGLPTVSCGGVVRFCGVASGDVRLPVAGFNADNCPVSADVSSFGEVKSLFR